MNRGLYYNLIAKDMMAKTVSLLQPPNQIAFEKKIIRDQAWRFMSRPFGICDAAGIVLQNIEIFIAAPSMTLARKTQCCVSYQTLNLPIFFLF